MRRMTCESCKTSITPGSAVIRGDLRKQRAWHPGCFTVYRAVFDVPAVAVPPRPRRRLAGAR